MSRKNGLTIRAIEGEILPEEQCYQSRLRQAVFNGVSEADVSEIVKNLTDKARSGDPKAVQVFFDYVLGIKHKPTNITVNNTFADVEQGARAARRLKHERD